MPHESSIRFFERQPGETPKAWEAFKIYRDLGGHRSLAKTSELYYGSTANLAQIGVWSRKNAWVDRVTAYDDYHEMIRREAIEKYERSHGTDLAKREARTQEELLEVKEILLPKMKSMARWPLEKRRVEHDAEGNEVTHIYPAKWSFHTLVKAIEILDDRPDKVAFTDPSGLREYGQDPDEVRRLFLDIVESAQGRDEDDR
jgi:hypothetical protein